MATLTSTHRSLLSSAHLAVAPTQNTAPVHEFCCLYTRDLHKKTKKWHDGSARFHTFNRRVMVYDDTRSFIGDLHYRQEEDFCEGVEIRLDRGVLVEVGERLGETQTDLAPILDRQRPEKGPSPRRQSVSLSTRLPSTGSSQRPKSLLEVLGPSQRRFGRARIPYQSPYEQRHHSARLAPDEPPQKRQRLSSDNENNSTKVHRVDRPAGPSLPQSMRPSKCGKRVPQLVYRDEPPVEFEEVLDLSSDEEPQRLPAQPARLTAKPGRNCKEAPEQHRLISTPTHQKPTPKPRPREAQTINNYDEGSRRNSMILQETTKATTRIPCAVSRPSGAGSARLVLSRREPRQKLICVLPFKNDAYRSGCSSISPRVSPPREGVTTSFPLEEGKPSHPSAAGLPTNRNDLALQIPISSLLSMAQEPERFQVPNSSPLFVPEEFSQPRLPSPRPLLTQDEFPFSDPDGGNAFEGIASLLAPQRSLPAQDNQGSPAKQMDAAAEITTTGRLASWRSPKSGDPGDVVSMVDSQGPPDNGLEHEITIEVDIEERVELAREIRPRPNMEFAKASEKKHQAEPETRLSPQYQPPTVNDSPLLKSRLEMDAPVQRQPPQAAGQIAGSNGRAFRRVLSENDALENDDATRIPELAISEQRSPASLLYNLSMRRSSAKFKGTSKIHRSASDTMTAAAEPPHVAKPTGEGATDPTGPWTVDEAFLLFDWWPVELQKPAYLMEATAAPALRTVAQMAPVFRGGIMTARQFLRDDANVL